MTAEERTEAIANEVIETGGTWQTPVPGARSCFTIALHGIEAPGIDADSAARHWHIQARAVIGGWPWPDDDPDLRAAQVEWAEMMVYLDPFPVEIRTQAARIAMRWSESRNVQHAARQILKSAEVAA
ncbi:MAG: hypothetical protein ACU0E9_04930 [Limimaricola soesokkakensis]|uniref:hypothetical protein n=1 Tax=Limimaricola soesokkakensis TaxID=1343159 RepID=UPI004059AEED